jgi:hypothetical protein
MNENDKALKSQAEIYHSQGYTARKQGDFMKAVELYSIAL